MQCGHFDLHVFVCQSKFFFLNCNIAEGFFILSLVKIQRNILKSLFKDFNHAGQKDLLEQSSYKFSRKLQRHWCKNAWYQVWSKSFQQYVLRFSCHQQLWPTCEWERNSFTSSHGSWEEVVRFSWSWPFWPSCQSEGIFYIL